MKNKFINIIIFLVVLGMVAIFMFFGMVIFEEMIDVQVSSKPEETEENIVNNNTNVSKADTIENDIKTPQVIESPLNKINGSSSNNQTDNVTNYTNVSVDKYFYNQLEEYSKTIYKAFESNKENMKTGTYQINLVESFSSLLSNSDGQDQLGKYYQSAIEAYTYDNPDVFYLSPNKMYLNVETTTKGNKVTYNVFINSGNEANYLNNEFSSKQEINAAIAQIEQMKNNILKNKTGNTYNDIKMVHDYLVDTITYDTTLSKENIYNIYGALVNKECVCEGYARAMKYLLDDLNIPCVIVIGKGTNSQGKTENHAWNYVQLNSSWYALDATWDDPVIIGGGTVSNDSKYKYFLKGKDVFFKDHTASGQFTEGGKVFKYPDIVQTSN